MNIKNNKKLFYIVMILLGIFVTGTFAYFAAVIMDGFIFDANVVADDTEGITTRVDKDLVFTPGQVTFGEGTGNQSDTVIGTIEYKSNKNGVTKTLPYYVYFNIVKNPMIYTTEDHKPEIILQVKDQNDNFVTDIDGLDYVTASGADGVSISGFDITTAQGVFKVSPDNLTITSTSNSTATTHNWKFIVTLLNLDSNQGANGRKSLIAHVHVQKELFSMVQYVSALAYEQGANNLRIHDGSLIGPGLYDIYAYTVRDANDNSIRYYGPEYIITDKAKNEGYTKIYDELIVRYCSSEVVSFDYNSTCSDGFFKVIPNDTIYDVLNSAMAYLFENGYVKRNLDNYVCFGYEGEYNGICDVDNLYRIIGVIGGKVKLIKAEFADSDLLGTDGTYSERYSPEAGSFYLGSKSSFATYYWDVSSNSESYKAAQVIGVYDYFLWKYSVFNLINLNTNYINAIDHGNPGSWSNLIADTLWNNTKSSDGLLSMAISYENQFIDEIYTNKAKIALMSVSDYAAGMPPEIIKFNNISSYGGGIRMENWLFTGTSENLLSKSNTGSSSNYPFLIYGYGHIYGNYFSTPMRPVFFLNVDVPYVSGTGSYEDPFIIK